MWLNWLAILGALLLAGMWLWDAFVQSAANDFSDGLSGGSGHRLEWGVQALRIDDSRDPLQLELEREERVARENFERRHARYPQFFHAEGQVRG